MFGMRKGLKYIAIDGAILSMDQGFRNVVIKDSDGYELKFDGISMAKEIQEHIEIGTPLKFYFLRYKHGNKLAAMLYAIEKLGKRYFIRDSAESLCKTFASAQSARGQFLFNGHEKRMIYICLCMLFSFMIYGTFASIRNILAPLGMVFAGIFIWWAWYPFFRPGKYAGISGIENIFPREKEEEEVKSYSNSKY